MAKKVFNPYIWLPANKEKTSGENTESEVIPKLVVQYRKRTVKDLISMYENLEEMRFEFRDDCKNFLLNFLKDSSSEKPYEVDWIIDVKDAIGLSSLEAPVLKKMWADNKNEIIWFYFEGIGNVDFTSLDDHELIYIIKEL